MNSFKSRLTYVLSCLTKLEKLLCLKYMGSKSLANSVGSQTTKLPPLSLQETTWLVEGSSTKSYVFERKGAGAFEPPWDPSIASSHKSIRLLQVDQRSKTQKNFSNSIKLKVMKNTRFSKPRNLGSKVAQIESTNNKSTLWAINQSCVLFWI